jgi:hypothetical protein
MRFRLVTMLLVMVCIIFVLMGFLLVNNEYFSPIVPNLQLNSLNYARGSRNVHIGKTFSKQDLWNNIKQVQGDLLFQHQYCMRWCPIEDFVNVSEWSLYRDLDPEEARELGSYAKTQARDVYQKFTADALNITCCQIATRESFTVVYDSRHSNDLEHDVTLVTFGTYDRLSAIHEIRKRWKGPIVLAFYLEDHNDLIFQKNLVPNRYSANEEFRRISHVVSSGQWDNIAILTYLNRFETDKTRLKIGFNGDYFNLRTGKFHDTNGSAVVLSREEAFSLDLLLLAEFPINSMRNVVQDFVQTRYVFAIDMDFIPDYGAYKYFVEQTWSIESLDKAGIILPHFDRRNCSWSAERYRYPIDFVQLDTQMKAGLIQPFH